jgi:TetR/AcrR family transcriptional repressor of nem operon
MGRVSQAQALQNRQHVVDAAARLFRERGVQGVSVADVMADAGLTHGGFYKRFASKDALLAEAVTEAFDGLGAQLTDRDEQTGDHATARQQLIDYYLSPAHRDDPGHGCPAAGLSVDVAREGEDSAAHEPYVNGVESFGEWLGDDGDEDLAALSTLVGSLLLARATRGTELSDRILAAGHAALTNRKSQT